MFSRPVRRLTVFDCAGHRQPLLASASANLTPPPEPGGSIYLRTPPPQARWALANGWSQADELGQDLADLAGPLPSAGRKQEAGSRKQEAAFLPYLRGEPGRTRGDEALTGLRSPERDPKRHHATSAVSPSRPGVRRKLRTCPRPGEL